MRDGRKGVRRIPRPTLVAGALTAYLLIACPSAAGALQYGTHEEGRAVDWRLSYADAGDRRDAARIKRVLAANHDELARRMGIQAVLWHCRWWGADQPSVRSRPLASCDPSDERRNSVGWRHDNHIHLELNWRGAHLLTSYWRLRSAKWRRPDPFRYDTPGDRCTHQFQPGARKLIPWLKRVAPRGEFKAAGDNPPPGERCLPAACITSRLPCPLEVPELVPAPPVLRPFL